MKKNNKKGFTLVELVIVVAVMAILVAIAIPTVGAITGKAKTAVDDSNAKTLESMIKLAEAEAVNDAKGATPTFAEEQIANAIAKAKLGITSGSFKYDVKTGTVKTGSGTASADLYNITFSTTTVTVKGTVEKTANLDGSTTPATTQAPAGGEG